MHVEWSDWYSKNDLQLIPQDSRFYLHNYGYASMRSHFLPKCHAPILGCWNSGEVNHNYTSAQYDRHIPYETRPVVHSNSHYRKAIFGLAVTQIELVCSPIFLTYMQIHKLIFDLSNLISAKSIREFVE